MRRSCLWWDDVSFGNMVVAFRFAKRFCGEKGFSSGVSYIRIRATRYSLELSTRVGCSALFL